VGTNTIQFLTDGTYQDYSEGEDGQYEVGGRYVFDGSTLTFEIDAYAPNGAGTTPPQGYNVVSSVPASLSTDGTTLTINGEDFTKQTTTTPGGTPVGFANVLPPDTLPPLTVLPTTA
jgi:hypothetical protein